MFEVLENDTSGRSPLDAGQGAGKDGIELGHARINALSQMQTYHWALATYQRLEIAHGQRHLQLPERVAGTGNDEILARVSSEDNKKALRGPTFIYLADGVEIAGAGGDQNGNLESGDEFFAKAAEGINHGGTELNEGKQSEITLRITKLEKRAKSLLHAERGNLAAEFTFGVEFEAVFSDADGCGGDVTTDGDLLKELRSGGLAFLDVGIVEGIYLKKKAGDGCSDLPFEKFDTEMGWSGEFDLHCGDAGVFQFLELCGNFRLIVILHGQGDNSGSFLEDS